MKFKFLILFSSIFAAGVLFLTLNRTTSNKASNIQVLGEQEKNQEAEVIIDFGNSELIVLKTKDFVGKNALDALKIITEKNSIKLQTKQYDFGVLVEAVGDKANSPDNSWMYFVNGDAGQVASDQYILKSGDKLEWKYIKPQF